MEVKCNTQHTLPISALTEFQGNLKKRTDKDFDKIEKSIKKHGFSFPFFVWKNNDINYVLDGHGRLGTLQRMVAKGEQLPALPVVYVDCKDEADAKELLLKLNSQYGQMTADSVREFLGDIQIDFDELALPDGFMDFTLPFEEKETVDDDEIPEVDLNETPDSQYGQIYQLGNHRLMCGDSTKEEDMALLMGEAKADLIVTDPPYNVAYTGGMQIKKGHIESNGKKMIKNDKMDYSNFYNFLYDVFTNLKLFSKNKSGIYVFYAHSQSRAFLNAFYDVGLKQRSIIIWHKTSGGFGDFMAHYMNAYEPCIYGSNGESVNWYGATNEKTVLSMDKEKKCDLHPTMKPVGLIEHLIKNSSKAEDIVLDTFGGSGTTIIAAEKQNRHARVMELDPHYCDVIRKRWTQWAKDNGVEVGAGGLE